MLTKESLPMKTQVLVFSEIEMKKGSSYSAACPCIPAVYTVTRLERDKS